ncbi:MAG: CHAT domain-containing protein [Mucilaginibacter sp.]|uniref:CHAT domain-containing protein n=1 Tax=Mucilaginibacter sp. TaxID=1882438 RepID=UPI0031B241F4
MKSFLGVVAWLGLMVLGIGICNAQCITDDSIHQEINNIKNTPGDNYSKIRRLQTLQSTYLKCYHKQGSTYAELMHRLGDYFAKTGDLPLGIAYTAAAVDINERSGTKEPFLCNSYYNLGIFYLQLNLIHLSNNSFNHCIIAGQNFPEKYFIVGMAHTQLAYAFFKAGDYQQAKNMAYQGLDFSEAAADSVEEGALWAQKAQAEVELADFINARQSIDTALSKLKTTTTIQLASVYSIYANLLNATGQYQASVLYYRKAFRLNKSLQNYTQCANDLNDLGNVYDSNLHRGYNARICYNEGLQLAMQHKNSYQMVGFYENIGVTYWREGNYRQALQFYQKGLNALPINFTDQLVTSNPSVGMLNKISNDYYVSTLLADKGESLLALYKQKHDTLLLKAALQTFLLADRSVDMMRWKQHTELSKLLWRSKIKQTYENAIEVCYLLNDPEKAFYFFEKSRSALLNDQLNTTLYTPSKLRTAEDKNLLLELSSINKKLSSLNYNNADTGLKKTWMSLHQQWEDRQNEQNSRRAESSILPGNSFWSIKSLQQELAKTKQTLIEYFYNNNTVYVLQISAIQAKIYQIPYVSYLHDSQEFLKYCSNAGLLNQQYDSYTRLASRLFQKLFEPLNVNTHRVIISPGEYFIPFDALLYNREETNSFLIRKYSFSYVYSMQVLFNHRPVAPDTKNFFLGVAPENYEKATKLQPLIGSVASLDRIQDEFKSALLLKGADAKKSRFLTQLPGSQIVQIYSHAASDSNSRDPVLYMADSAVLMSDIQKLQCRYTNMVVLSACNTGTGYRAVGEGLFSLARGFRLAGIPSTVTNLWQADNQATYLLTESFYKYLRTGLPKDEALRSAKLDLLTNNQSYLLPYFWGSTIILGDSSPLIVTAASGGLNFYCLIGFLPVLIVFAGGIYLLSYSQKKSDDQAD